MNVKGNIMCYIDSRRWKLYVASEAGPAMQYFYGGNHKKGIGVSKMGKSKNN